jgi:hypothetical protein
MPKLEAALDDAGLALPEVVVELCRGSSITFAPRPDRSMV